MVDDIVARQALVEIAGAVSSELALRPTARRQPRTCGGGGSCAAAAAGAAWERDPRASGRRGGRGICGATGGACGCASRGLGVRRRCRGASAGARQRVHEPSAPATASIAVTTAGWCVGCAWSYASARLHVRERRLARSAASSAPREASIRCSAPIACAIGAASSSSCGGTLGSPWSALRPRASDSRRGTGQRDGVGHGLTFSSSDSSNRSAGPRAIESVARLARPRRARRPRRDERQPRRPRLDPRGAPWRPHPRAHDRDCRPRAPRPRRARARAGSRESRGTARRVTIVVADLGPRPGQGAAARTRRSMRAAGQDHFSANCSSLGAGASVARRSSCGQGGEVGRRHRLGTTSRSSARLGRSSARASRHASHAGRCAAPLSEDGSRVVSSSSRWAVTPVTSSPGVDRPEVRVRRRDGAEAATGARRRRARGARTARRDSLRPEPADEQRPGRASRTARVRRVARAVRA